MVVLLLKKKLVALSKVLLIVALLNVPLISSEVQALHFKNSKATSYVTKTPKEPESCMTLHFQKKVLGNRGITSTSRYIFIISLQLLLQ